MSQLSPDGTLDPSHPQWHRQDAQRAATREQEHRRIQAEKVVRLEREAEYKKHKMIAAREVISMTAYYCWAIALTSCVAIICRCVIIVTASGH
jgi:hypothetical protein